MARFDFPKANGQFLVRCLKASGSPVGLETEIGKEPESAVGK